MGLGQREFDFQRSEQLAILRDCCLPRLAIGRGAGISPLAMKAVLTAIDQFARYDRRCTAAVSTLAAVANLGVRTARRALRHLECLGVICREADRHVARGTPTNRYVIVWTELALLCPERVRSRGATTGSPTDCHGTAPRGPVAELPAGPEHRRPLPRAPDQRPPLPDQRPPCTDQRPPLPPKRLTNDFEAPSRRLDAAADLGADGGSDVGRDGAMRAVSGERAFSGDEVQAIRSAANRLGALAKPATPSDRELLLKIATLAHDHALSEDSLCQVFECFQRKREKHEPIPRPFGLLWATLRNQCSRAGCRLESLLVQTDFPRELL